MPDDKPGKKENPFEHPGDGTGWMAGLVVPQTTWAVLILAFLAGLLAELPIFNIVTDWLLIAPIGLYTFLFVGLCTSIHGFLIASARVHYSGTLYEAKFDVPNPGHGVPLLLRFFKGKELNKNLERFVFVIMAILFYAVMISITLQPK